MSGITILAAIGTAVLGFAVVYGVALLIYDTHCRRIRQHQHQERERRLRAAAIAHPAAPRGKRVQLFHQDEWREKHADVVRHFEEQVEKRP